MAFTFKTLLKDNMLFCQYRFLKPPHQVKSILQMICLAYCLDSVLNVKALVGTFNQEKAQVGIFSVIVKTLRRFVVSSF